MGPDLVTAYVLTSGSSALLERTRASLIGAATVVELRVDASGAAPEVPPRSDASRTGWDLLLREGEELNTPSLQAALRTGAPRTQPSFLDATSVAVDALLGSCERLAQAGGASALVDSMGRTGMRSESRRGGEQGATVSWAIRRPPITMASTPTLVAWALARAVIVSRREVAGALSPGESLDLAGLLLLAGEWDAVLRRALAALRRRTPREHVASWARLGLAAALCVERHAEAAICLKRWRAASPELGEAGVQAFWRGVVGEHLREFSTLIEEEGNDRRHGTIWTSADVDPWFSVVRGAAAAHRRSSAHVLAIDALRARPREAPDLERLVELWRGAGLAPERLIEQWPGADGNVLLHGLFASQGRDAEWWLEVAKALLRRQENPMILDAGAGIAARCDLATAVDWTVAGLKAGATGASALRLRAQCDALDPVARAVAAACEVAVTGEVAMALLSEAIDVVHTDDAEALLTFVNDAAPSALPSVVRLFCGADDQRISAMQRVLVAFGAQDQAVALEALRTEVLVAP